MMSVEGAVVVRVIKEIGRSCDTDRALPFWAATRSTLGNPVCLAPVECVSFLHLHILP